MCEIFCYILRWFYNEKAVRLFLPILLRSNIHRTFSLFQALPRTFNLIKPPQPPYHEDIIILPIITISKLRFREVNYQDYLANNRNRQWQSQNAYGEILKGNNFVRKSTEIDVLRNKKFKNILIIHVIN